MKLIIVRHGETEDNAKRILQGHMHGTLNRNGKEQARRIALRLKNRKIDVIISSDLKRASHTTDEIAKYHKAPVLYSKALRERHYGIFQGKHLDRYLEAEQVSKLQEIDFRPKGGESLTDLKNRVHRFVEGLYKEYPNKTVLLSTHNGVVWCIISIYLGVPLEKVRSTKIKNTGILVIKVGDKSSKLLEDKMS